jgi:hypothetical protein
MRTRPTDQLAIVWRMHTARRNWSSPCRYPSDGLVSAGKEGRHEASTISEEQIITILKEAEGIPTTVCRDSVRGRQRY